MKAAARIFLWIIIFNVSVLKGFSQQDQSVLVNRMLQLESSILETYLEYQKLYYEDKSREKELIAFENLLTVYINQVMEIYETLTLAERETQTPRDIAARTLVFKALMFLEKAPLNIEYYEYACYEYFEALELYKNIEEPPVIYKDLPRVIQAGDKNYYRLVDILEDKGQGLNVFGKINIAFKNFMVTANFDPQMIEIIKVNDPQHPDAGYTYQQAQPRIIKAFEEVFRSSKEISTYVALPQGTYILRLKQGNKSHYTTLTTLYVRNNQEQYYIMEPLGDWIILYEDPKSKRPDFYKFRRNKETFEMSNLSDLKDANLVGNGRLQEGSESKENRTPSMTKIHVQLISEIVAHFLPQFDISGMFNFNNPESKDTAIETISLTIVKYVESPMYYNQWSLWTTSWDISKEVRVLLSPGTPIPIELVKLIYKTLKEI